jgi:hypothetical protein
VIFGSKDNYRIENIIFDVADIALPYNGIIGQPTLAQFMVVTHHAYHALKLPSPWGTLIVKADTKDAVLCAEQMFKSVATASPSPSSDSDHPCAPIPGSFGKRLRPFSELCSDDM